VRTRPLFRAIQLACGAAGIAGLAWAGLAPIETRADGNREELFEIPRGTWAARRSGQDLAILPDEIRLTLGIKDVLVLRNLDDVPQVFGPTLMMPGQSFRLPFEQASEYQFNCTAHASGQMRVIVYPYPATPWARILWRARRL
jgi:hypothetical protein